MYSNQSVLVTVEWLNVTKKLLFVEKLLWKGLPIGTTIVVVKMTFKNTNTHFKTIRYFTEFQRLRALFP